MILFGRMGPCPGNKARGGQPAALCRSNWGMGETLSLERVTREMPATLLSEIFGTMYVLLILQNCF